MNKALTKAKELIASGERNANKVINLIQGIIGSEPLAKTDYIQVVDSLSIEPVENINKPVLVAIAVFIGETSLLDNYTFEF